jgi:hypothetical protein
MGLWLPPIETMFNRSEFGGSSKPSTADPAPKCNNQPQQPSLVVTNEWTMHTTQTKQQSNKEQ